MRSTEDLLRELAQLLEAELHARGATTDVDPPTDTLEDLAALCLLRGRALRYGWESSQ